MKEYSIPEAAKILGVSRVTLFRRVKSGKIKARKVGRNYVVPESSLPKPLTPEQIEKIVDRAIIQYGETFRLLGKEDETSNG